MSHLCLFLLFIVGAIRNIAGDDVGRRTGAVCVCVPAHVHVHVRARKGAHVRGLRESPPKAVGVQRYLLSTLYTYPTSGLRQARPTPLLEIRAASGSQHKP